eukprot:sb/3465307/
MNIPPQLLWFSTSMKLLSNRVDRSGHGYMSFIPEEGEDLWHVYNLITAGDVVRCTTLRKVVTESSTGSTNAQRVKTNLTIRVETVSYDVEAMSLALKGRNIEENQYVKMGAYHTLSLELQRKFTLTKEYWDAISRERVDEACEPAKSADLAAIVLQEGLGYVCLVRQSMTITRAKIEIPIPRKRRGSCTNHDKAMLRFFDAIGHAMVRHIDFAVVKCVLVASPGFVKDKLMEYILSTERPEFKPLQEQKSSFVLCHSSSGHKHAVSEVLSDQNMTSRLADTKAAGEVRALTDFYTMLNNEPARAFYGPAQCLAANENEAIDVLLVTDTLFRSTDIAERRKYVRLVENVRGYGGTVHIFSSLHGSGEKVRQLSLPFLYLDLYPDLLLFLEFKVKSNRSSPPYS